MGCNHEAERRGLARLLGTVVCAVALGCNAYDRRSIDMPSAGKGGEGNGTAGHAPPNDAGRTEAGAPAPGKRDAALDGDAAVDGGADAAVGCTANPGSTSCPEICPERCNGTDDDCDGETDEGGNEDCAAEHALSVCQGGECLIVECLDGYRDCDDDASTGCEVARDDPNHCGQCGKACDLLNAIPSCADGVCVAIGCADGYGDCDQADQTCETPLASLEHCGGCNVPCGGLANASPQCDTGACGVKDCLGNFGDCNDDAADGCETPLDTLADCGGCGVPCELASCVGGVCTAVTCSDPMADCDADGVDCEIDLSSDPDHCGGCGRACAFQTATPRGTLSCENRACRAMCEAGYGDCDEDYASGCETPLATTAAHCGACGNNCTDLLPHTASTTCQNSSCRVGTCANGWADCDGVAANGCERNTTVEGPCFPDSNCVRQTHGTHEYFFCTNSRNWADARARCRLQARGDLVSIGSSAENAFVTMHRTANSWIGARDAAIEGLWRWENNGHPFWRGTASGSAQLSQYENWSNNQPDDWQSNEDCAEILADGTWNDVGCGGGRAFICEVSPDECPQDSNKIDPGQCGCGNADTDSDGDGFANCVEGCDGDPNKQAPGVCGCGMPDTNADGDAQPDCMDGCPVDPTQTAACLGFTPTNFDPNTINWSAQPTATLNCGTTTVNTSDPDGSGSAVATITNWCGTAPVPIVQAQNGGPDVVIIPLRGLSVASGNTLRLIGSRPVILAVDGDVNVAGTIDASANGTTPGAGGNWMCGGSTGGNGSGSSSLGAGGGGGGGFGTAGGQGGSGGSGSRGGAGGTRGTSSLTPLIGGCGGGRGGGCGTAGAGGGGAVQITASGTLTVTGTVRANGGQGTSGCGSEGGGTGGGSGGAIFLEASTLSTGGGTVQANGGRGGNGAGGGNGGNGSTSSGSNGSNGGSDALDGGGGGGGGYGRIRQYDR